MLTVLLVSLGGAWLVGLVVVTALCRAASRGDDVLARQARDARASIAVRVRGGSVTERRLAV